MRRLTYGADLQYSKMKKCSVTTHNRKKCRLTKWCSSTFYNSLPR